MARLEGLVRQARGEGKEIVVVMGVGFVGAVMAAIIADTVDKKTGKPSKFVIGCQRPSPRSYWKIPHAQPRRVAGQGRGPRGRSDDRPLRQGEEDADRPRSTATA